jgi:hypothetical protein
MTEIEQTAEGVEYWLKEESFTSGYDRNRSLDLLEPARQALIDHNDPKISGYMSRYALYLSQYIPPKEGDMHQAESIAHVSFRALTFVSAAYRRQRYLQAVSTATMAESLVFAEADQISAQNDYLRRKLEWDNPGGVEIVPFMLERLEQDAESELSYQTIRELGEAAIDVTANSMTLIYDRTPEDFGKEKSPSVDSVRLEQETWLAQVSRVLTHSSRILSVPMLEVPVLEPKSSSDATVLTTLSALMANRR